MEKENVFKWKHYQPDIIWFWCKNSKAYANNQLDLDILIL
ncbi:hypothetical protein YBT020_29271 (plasmid) [Bacillus thuringiensis serovar finitimus YBT-020]|nr:hypothetical protein YBT020_29271 [Bacillus thuringiensis serovar finitimus YBT-020]